MRYEHIRVADELDRNLQRGVGMPPRREETLGELVKSIAAERWAAETPQAAFSLCRKPLISREIGSRVHLGGSKERSAVLTKGKSRCVR